jgi:aldose 1-epimerase
MAAKFGNGIQVMRDVINFEVGDFFLSIAPNASGGIARLDWRGHPILRPALEGAVNARDPLGLSSFPMTPYVSRITDGVFTWGDVTTDIAPNMVGGAHPLHGIGWRKAWKIVSQTDTSLILELVHDGDVDWPWSFVTRQHFALYGDYVEHVLEVTSTDGRPFPASLGPHPYFNATDATITFGAQALWEISGESLPTHKARPHVVDDLGAGVAASSLDLDHCFEGWNGRAKIAWSDYQVRIEAQCALDGVAYPCTRLQLYTPRGKNFFCLEPVTARCVAFTEPDPSIHGVVELGGQTLTITTRFYPSTQ